MYSLTDTIIACSSPPGRGAISIIRISGGDLTELFKKIGIKKIGNKESLVKELQLNSDFKEKCVLTFFKSPNSFTGEDILEINCRAFRPRNYCEKLPRSSRVHKRFIFGGHGPLKPPQF